MRIRHKRCSRPCKYRAAITSINGCDYLSITGHSRGCQPGEECTKFEEGERSKLIMDEWSAPKVTMEGGISEILLYAKAQRRLHQEWKTKNHM